MPKTKSAKKALRQSKKRREHNLFYKNKIKFLQKEIKKTVSKKETLKATSLLSLFYKTLDKAVKEKVIKKNTAARKKAKFSKLVNSLSKEVKSEQ